MFPHLAKRGDRQMLPVWRGARGLSTSSILFALRVQKPPSQKQFWDAEACIVDGI